MMSDLSRIQVLHERCKKLSLDELIHLYLGIQANNGDQKLKKIFKTYIYRKLQEEGIR